MFVCLNEIKAHNPEMPILEFDTNITSNNTGNSYYFTQADEGYRAAGATQRSLTPSSTSGGTITVPGVGTYRYGRGGTVCVTAAASVNSHFVNWTGTAVTSGKVADPASESTTVIVDGDYTLQANFDVTRYTLTIISTVGGIVSMPATGTGTCTHAAGEVVWVAATADPSFKFVGWRGGFYSNQNQASVTVNGDLTVEAQFESVLSRDDRPPGQEHRAGRPMASASTWARMAGPVRRVCPNRF
jgi:hypothetical protein